MDYLRIKTLEENVVIEKGRNFHTLVPTLSVRAGLYIKNIPQIEFACIGHPDCT